MKLVTDIRSSFWFVPSLIVVACALLAIGAIELDAIVGSGVLAQFPRLFGARAEGARELLSTIAGSTITVAGVVFSITIVALSLTAAQYSPRVLRNFMADRGNQIVLGVFVGVYVYCLLVLRTVRAGDDGFVPGISIVGGLLLAVVGTGVLMFFIHHIALSIQVSHIAARISGETIAAMDKINPEAPTVEGTRIQIPDDPLFRHGIPATENGYVQRVDTDRLARLARSYERVVRIEKTVGEFVVRGENVMSVTGRAQPDRVTCKAMLATYAINDYRDMRQDPYFGVEQLVDIALRALSPGVNDLGTARTVLDHLTAILCAVAKLNAEERTICEAGALAVVKRTRSFEHILDEAISPIRQSATHQTQFLVQLLASLATIARMNNHEEQRGAIRNHVRAIQEAAPLSRMPRTDAKVLSAALEEALAASKAEPVADLDSQRHHEAQPRAAYGPGRRS
jgi:uncharacterized membrane protein